MNRGWSTVTLGLPTPRASVADHDPLAFTPIHHLMIGGLVEGQLKVEDPAWVDLTVPDQAGQLRQEPAYRRRTAEQVHLGVEQFRAGQLDTVSDADVADVPAGAGGADGLHHRLLGADGLDHRVRAEPAGELRHLRHARIAAFGDDIGRAELVGELLAELVPAHRDDLFGA
jgi:hypothetical protein